MVNEIQKSTSSKLFLIVVVCNFILGAFWNSPFYVDPYVSIDAYPLYTMEWIYFDDALMCIYLLSLCWIVFKRNETAKRVFIGLAFFMLLRNIYYTLLYETHLYNVTLIPSGHQVMESSNIIEYLFPSTGEVPESLASMDWDFWWGLTESVLCFLWLVFNYWFYFARDRKTCGKAVRPYARKK